MIRTGTGHEDRPRAWATSASRARRARWRRCARVPIGRRIYLHINNTNPILLEDSPERAAVAAAGWEVAYDGMEISL